MTSLITHRSTPGRVAGAAVTAAAPLPREDEIRAAPTGAPPWPTRNPPSDPHPCEETSR